jgi:hypothetical protein
MAYCAAALLSSLTQSRFELRPSSRPEGSRDGLEETENKVLSREDF